MACDRFYTHSIVSYADLGELMPLLSACNHYVYICHDQDVTDTHYHIIATFPIQKSIKAVRNMVNSTQNTFSQPVKDLESLFDYLSHEHEDKKHTYSKDDFVFDDQNYWSKRLKDGEVIESKNDMFVDDLMSENMTLEFMARKYGRDFIKNKSAYLEFRQDLQYERECIKKYKYNPYGGK